MTKENKAILIKRIKSFLWRGGMIAIVAVINFAAGNLDLFNLPAEVVVIVSLVLSEITKQLNK